MKMKLPEGWEKKVDDFNNISYYNKDNKTS